MRDLIPERETEKMKIIVAAKETQGQRADDFNFADEGEIVIVADCDHLHHQIYALHEEQHSPKQIARNLCVHPATTSRELRRNHVGRGYRPKQADDLARARKRERTTPRIGGAMPANALGM